jgi:hypothetical protein
MEKKKLGVFYNAPKQNQPEFVKGSIAIHLETFLEAVKGEANDNGYIYLDFLKGEPKENNATGLYFKLNNWKPKPQEPTQQNEVINTENISW